MVDECIVTDGVRVPPGASYRRAILLRGGDGDAVRTAPLDPMTDDRDQRTTDGLRAARTDRSLPARQRARRPRPARRAADRRRLRPPLLPRHPSDGPSIVLALHAGPIDFATLPFANVARAAAADAAAGAGDPRTLGRARHPRAAGSRRRHAAGASRRGDAGRARGALPPGGRAHRACCSGAAPSSRRTGYLPYRIAFDVEKLTWELDFFVKHFLEGYRGVDAVGRPSATALGEEWAAIVEELAAEPRVLCHRDYHSRNLMLHDGSLYIIDFQDARMGPDTYDLVSLLRDSYVDLTDRELDELIAYFLALKGTAPRPTATSSGAASI